MMPLCAFKKPNRIKGSYKYFLLSLEISLPLRAFASWVLTLFLGFLCVNNLPPNVFNCVLWYFKMDLSLSSKQWKAVDSSITSFLFYVLLTCVWECGCVGAIMFIVGQEDFLGPVLSFCLILWADSLLVLACCSSVHQAIWPVCFWLMLQHLLVKVLRSQMQVTTSGSSHGVWVWTLVIRLT